MITGPNREEDIVVSGIGVVSPIGIGWRQFWENLDSGKTGIKKISSFDTSGLNAKLGGEITEFKAEEIIGPSGLRNYDRCINLSISAAKLALDDAGLTIEDGNRERVGIVLGSSLGNIKTTSDLDKQFLREGPRSLDPGKCPNVVICSSASQISIRFGIKGFTATIAAGFNSSLSAFKYSLDLLRSKRVDYVLVGAVEELCEPVYKGFYNLGYLSGSRYGRPEINAPFDRRRNGFVFGEGAVVFVFEHKTTAEQRGSSWHAAIEKFGVLTEECDSYHSLTHSLRQTDSIASKFSSHLNSDLEAIDFVGLSANSSVLGDAIESNLMRTLFSSRKSYPLAGAIKSLTGESYSAGGSFQLLGALYSLERQRVFPTMGFSFEDKRCPVPFLTRDGVKGRIDKALVWSLGYGRTNMYIICSKSNKN